MRGLIDRKGEMFGYLIGNELYTLDDELTGRIDGRYIVDLHGKPVWLLIGDAVYMLDGIEVVGFFGSERPHYYN